MKGAQVVYALVLIVLMIGAYVWIFGPKHIHSTTTVPGVGTTTMDCTGTVGNTDCTFQTTP
jgi:hypothetical protein